MLNSCSYNPYLNLRQKISFNHKKARERIKVDIEIRRLGKETKDDFLRFFDKDAFTDNPEWDGCYCQFYLDEKACANS